MTTVSVPDFTAIINDLVKTQGDLTERLTHLEELFDYMLTSDFTQVKPSALQAQLTSMDKLITEAKTASKNVQTNLTSQVLPQLTAFEK